MADSSPLAGLLDRAGNVFSLAGELGRAFSEEHPGHGRQTGESGWNRHAGTFEEFCTALLDLRDAMQSPPDGFGPVAKSLLAAARIARRIRDTMQRPEGPTWAAYLDFFPSLNSVCQDGLQAVDEVRRSRRLDDPLAFVDEHSEASSMGPSREGGGNTGAYPRIDLVAPGGCGPGPPPPPHLVSALIEQLEQARRVAPWLRARIRLRRKI